MENSNKPKKALEKRSQIRKLCFLDVDYPSHLTQDRDDKDTILDLSTGGLFIDTKKSFSINQKLIMRISFGSSISPFEVTGKVVYKMDYGIGVKFEDQTTGQRKLINLLMEKIADLNMIQSLK